MEDCKFCDIISGNLPSFQFYEDERYIGILDIFPAVRGQSLVIPKQHFGSYVFEMNKEDYVALMVASRKVAHLLDERLGSMRTCMVMEGMEIDHAHIKLYPLYKIGSPVSHETIDLNVYPGYLSTKHGERMPNSQLEAIASALRR